MGKGVSMLFQSESSLSLGSVVEKKDIKRQHLVFLVILVLKVKESVASILRPSSPQLKIISLT